MLNKQLLVSKAGITVKAESAPPISKDVGQWMANFSFIFSLIAIVVSVISLRLGARRDRRASFESDYGAALRASLRDLEEAVDGLRAFAFPSAKSLEELQLEIPESQERIERRAFKVVRISGEIDRSKNNRSTNWSVDLERKFELCADCLESLLSPSLSGLGEFIAKAERSREQYVETIAQAAIQLDFIRSKV